jgi:adenosine deaminase
MANVTAAMTKAELHVHLEGAIPHEALWQVIAKYGGDSSVSGTGDLARRFRFRTFGEFIEAWNWKNAFLREYDDFRLIAEAVARDLARQNIVYSEIFFSPADFRHHGLNTQRLAEAIRSGFSRVGGITIRLIADLVRDYGPEQADRTLSEVAEVKTCGLVGIGIGGTEHLFPAGQFAAVFERARSLGFHTTAHAGETAGAESIWQAIELLRVERIGHATRAFEDPRLMAHLSAARTPIEVCPTSNVRTGIVRSIEDHPVREYLRRGLFVTINTDDPAIFGNSLDGEFELVADALKLTDAQIKDLTLNAARAAWLSETDRSALMAAMLGESDQIVTIPGRPAGPRTN